jgi:hypothetical protein
MMRVHTKVGLFIPCDVEQCYPDVGLATVDVLERHGVEVDDPAAQTCCGQPMANSGYGTRRRHSPSGSSGSCRVALLAHPPHRRIVPVHARVVGDESGGSFGAAVGHAVRYAGTLRAANRITRKTAPTSCSATRAARPSV